MREELEKLNVWVAYFNLENEYGNPPEVSKTMILTHLCSLYFTLQFKYLPLNPISLITPQEAVAKVFQRALQYCDPKKVHLALLGMYERTEQHKLTDELLNKMVKKFKHSCKVVTPKSGFGSTFIDPYLTIANSFCPLYI